MKDWESSIALVSIGFLLMATFARAPEPSSSGLLNLSLEQLSNIEVAADLKRTAPASEAAPVFAAAQESKDISVSSNIAWKF